jgi:AcrR family transcriptional regulator
MRTSTDLRERRRQQRMERVLEAAMQSVEEHGIRHPALLEDVANRIAVTRPGLYRYFPDREGLLRALMEWKSQDLLAQLEAQCDAAASVPDALTRFARSVVRYQISNPAYLELVLSASDEPYPEHQHPMSPLADLLAEYLARAGADPGTCRQRAVGVLGMLFSPSLKRHLNPDIDAAAMEETLVTMTLLCAQPSC